MTLRAEASGSADERSLSDGVRRVRQSRLWRVRMVALDLDGTLVDQEGAARRWATEFIQSRGLTADVVAVALALTQRRPKGEVFNELVRTHDLGLDPDEVWANYRQRMPELVTCTDADREALIALRATGWRVGIVTNGMVDNQEGKIRQLGLDSLVDAWVISEEVGIRKPLPGIFHALAARLECPLDGWMIGDSLELDVVGGAAVGLRTALISGAEPTQDGAHADLLVASVAEAAEAIMSDAT